MCLWRGDSDIRLYMHCVSSFLLSNRRLLLLSMTEKASPGSKSIVTMFALSGDPNFKPAPPRFAQVN
jgi:hypothetical protein